MAQWHLDELEQALNKRGWRIAAKLDGDGYCVSATWQVERGNDSRKVMIDFDGLDDLRTLPIEQSYGCRLRGTSNSLYFGQRGARTAWGAKLERFVELMEH